MLGGVPDALLQSLVEPSGPISIRIQHSILLGQADSRVPSVTRFLLDLDLSHAVLSHLHYDLRDVLRLNFDMEQDADFDSQFSRFEAATPPLTDSCGHIGPQQNEEVGVSRYCGLAR
jgi:hypothetical protein